MAHNSLVYRSSSSTEAVIQRRIEGIQKMIKIHNSPQGEEEKETAMSFLIDQLYGLSPSEYFDKLSFKKGVSQLIKT
jgi:hypothetical protein